MWSESETFFAPAKYQMPLHDSPGMIIQKYPQSKELTMHFLNAKPQAVWSIDPEK